MRMRILKRIMLRANEIGKKIVRHINSTVHYANGICLKIMRLTA
jgi:hypothetical protein